MKVDLNFCKKCKFFESRYYPTTNTIRFFCLPNRFLEIESIKICLGVLFDEDTYHYYASRLFELEELPQRCPYSLEHTISTDKEKALDTFQHLFEKYRTELNES